jgi:hypothetical protein
LFNPHCEHCHEEKEDSKVCKSCETLKEQLESVNHEKNKLLERILERPVVETPAQPERKVSVPKVNIPWNVRRQMLEHEDREQAKLLRDAPQPTSTEQLEKDLDVASNTRQAEGRQ